jgi:hypothetical protein
MSLPFHSPTYFSATEPQKRVIELGFQKFYEVVPRSFRLHCHFNSQILARTFKALGLDAEVLPCQVMCSAAESVTVLGFAASPDSVTGGWTGHAVCRVYDWLIDAATFHFNQLRGIPTPEIAYSNIFPVASPVLGRFQVSDSIKLWWMKLPPDFEVTYPAENEELIATYSSQLTALLRHQLAL